MNLSGVLKKLPPWTFTTLVIAAILYLTLVPRPLPPMKILLFPHADKVVHALMFGAVVLAMVADYARKGGTRIIRFTVISACVSIALGGIVELLQASMRMGRSGDWFDLLADAGGALICAGIAPLLVSIFKR